MTIKKEIDSARGVWNWAKGMGLLSKEIGALARPDDVRFTDALPKTRSGKIMPRPPRDVAAGREGKGDTTTLEDYEVLAKLRAEDEA